MKKLLKLLLLLSLSTIFLSVSAHGVKAIYDPTSTQNNKVGMGVLDTSDLHEVAKLVNSNDGDWGYVTLVIQKGERSPQKWQQIFDEMRRLHLIPIIRIASAPIPGNENVWEIPSNDEIDGWVSFLNSLNWVIKNRYVIIGNEPNHASEWGGVIDPSSYAKYLKKVSQKLKAASDDFFIMPAPLDASATTSFYLQSNSSTMDEAAYLEKMFATDPDVFSNIDGWASHSYPNPNFSGPGDGKGKGSVSTFSWELDYLKFLGVKKDLPVFITETGWQHDKSNLVTDIGPKIETAYNKVWNDKRVIAITPFIYKYTTSPFDVFSWKAPSGNFFDFYQNVLNLPKVKGEPIQIVKGNVLTGIVPKIAMSNSIYHAIMFIKNNGQSIWKINTVGATSGDGSKLTIEAMFPAVIEPDQIGVFLIGGQFPGSAGNYNNEIIFMSDGKIASNAFVENVNLIPSFPNISEILNYLKVVIARKIGLRL